MEIIECIPNFSEGQRPEVIKAIADAITSVVDVTLLHVDSGYTTNRTVMTFVGPPEAVVEAAFRAIKIASENIDMSIQKGAHPRMGATDVCPLVPISRITMDEVVKWSERLAERVGKELKIPVYLYEYSARSEIRKNLANIRSGEYEALPEKMETEEWQPDFGPYLFNATAGATVIGARDFLIAYNINLNTSSEKEAWEIAYEVRERGKVQRDEHGKVVTDEDGIPVRIHGKCRAVKAIGWYINEFHAAQVSLNLVNLQATPIHIAFEAVRESAEKRGLEVTGSELVGLIPLQSMLDAGRYFAAKNGVSINSHEGLIGMAIESLGLDKIKSFVPSERIIEYRMREKTHFNVEKLVIRK